MLVVVSLDSQFRDDPNKLVIEINEANTIAGYRFDKSYTREEGIHVCQYTTCIKVFTVSKIVDNYHTRANGQQLLKNLPMHVSNLVHQYI